MYPDNKKRLPLPEDADHTALIRNGMSTTDNPCLPNQKSIFFVGSDLIEYSGTYAQGPFA